VYESSELADYLSEHEGEVLEVIGAIAGFKAYHLIKTGEGTISVSVFDGEESAAESANAAAAWLRENPPSFELAPPQVHAGEVVIDKA
jgi:hypothetical protein